MNRSMLIASCLALCVIAAPADTLSPGEILGTTFTTVPNTSDVAAVSFDVPLQITGSPVLTADLYNGSALLASFVEPITPPYYDNFNVGFGTAAGFASVPFTYPNSVATDFTSFNNGTIQGRLDISVSGGSISLNVPADVVFISGTLFNEGDFAAIAQPNDMTAAPFTISSATPEPTSFLLVACGCFFVFTRRRPFR